MWIMPFQNVSFLSIIILTDGKYKHLYFKNKEGAIFLFRVYLQSQYEDPLPLQVMLPLDKWILLLHQSILYSESHWNGISTNVLYLCKYLGYLHCKFFYVYIIIACHFFQLNSKNFST